jgi:WD40 repeat protein
VFQAGGAVREGLLYIERPADQELPEALRRGEFCYVLAPRQIGKTSLALRTRQKLSTEGIRCAAVDLNAIGSHVTPEEWFYTLVASVAEELDLEEHVEGLWDAHAKESLPSRWTRFCRKVVLEEVKAPVVIFLDEIDSILSVPHVADDFFASIRAMHEKREEDPVLARLSFCLLGVAAPRDLMRDEARTPFNIGRSIHLEDFTPAEAERLIPGLAGLGHAPRALLEAILAWTNGHPYMTLKVANALVQEGSGSHGEASAQERVEGWVRRLFLENGRQEEPNLRYAEDRFSRGKRSEQIPKMLRLYRRLLAGERIAAVGGDPVQQEFRLTGMVAERRDGAGRWLRVRNRIFATVFHETWVREKEAGRIVAEPLQQWLEQGRSRDLLLRGALLEQAQEWARQRQDLTPEEREFLEDSRELMTQTRARRVVVGVLASALLVLLVMVAVLIQVSQTAVEAQKKAEQADARTREASGSLMKATARLSAEVGLQPGAGADAINAALSTLVLAKQIQAPEPLEAFLGITRGVSDLKYSTLLKGHEDSVWSAAFSLDGTRVVTASADKTARVWDSRTGQLVSTLKGHEDSVLSAAFSPDGTRVVTASEDKTARVWDSRTGQLVSTLKGHEARVWSAEFSPDGTRVVTASEDKTARVWDSRTGQLVSTLKGHEDSVWSAEFSPDGTRVVTASADKTARLWDSRTGQLVSTLKGHENRVWSAEFSPDGTRVVTASADKTARLWDSRTGQLVSTLKGHEDSVWSAAFSLDGTRVVTASKDKTARVWDSRTGQLVSTLKGHEDRVWSAAFSLDGTRVVTASKDKTVRVWDSRTGQLVSTLKGHEASVRGAAFSPDGTRVVTASEDKTVRVWDSRTGQLVSTLKGHEDSVRSAEFSSDGTRVVTASVDTTARLWDSRTGQLVSTLKGHEASVLSAEFSPDGTRVVTASEDKTARLWIASPEGWITEACNLPQFTPATDELREFCRPYLGRTP